MAKNIPIELKKINTYEGMFKTEKDNSNVSSEIELCLLKEHPNHPFKPYKDEAMHLLKESIKEHGLLHPIVVWKKGDEYFILSGHNRAEACRGLGYTSIKAIILDDINEYQADQIVVESNLRQRQEILPSERAKAYKLLAEAHSKQGYRSDLHGQSVKFSHTAYLKEKLGISKSNLYRYIALAKLIPKLIDKVDEEKLPLQVGFDLCGISKQEQEVIYSFFIVKENAKLSSSVSRKILKASKIDTISKEVLWEITQKKEKLKNEIVLKFDDVEEYLTDIPSQERKEYIMDAIKFFSEHNRSNL